MIEGKIYFLDEDTVVVRFGDRWAYVCVDPEDKAAALFDSLEELRAYLARNPRELRLMGKAKSIKVEEHRIIIETDDLVLDFADEI